MYVDGYNKEIVVFSLNKAKQGVWVPKREHKVITDTRSALEFVKVLCQEEIPN